jgi:hypothetical protein
LCRLSEIRVFPALKFRRNDSIQHWSDTCIRRRPAEINDNEIIPGEAVRHAGGAVVRWRRRRRRRPRSGRHTGRDQLVRASSGATEARGATVGGGGGAAAVAAATLTVCT